MAQAKHRIPAIIRPYSDDDRDITVREVNLDEVNFVKGFGETGYRIETVEHTCPACDFDRMVRMHRVSTEVDDKAKYWCLNPNCGHYLKDELSYAFRGSNSKQKPTERK